MEQTNNSAPRSTFSAGQLVWVRVGKTDHHAHIVSSSSTSRCEVKWCSTGEIEEVDSSTISPGLTPRKRNRSNITSTSSGGGSKRSGSRLSLGRNRKRLAKSREKTSRQQIPSENCNAAGETTGQTPAVASRQTNSCRNTDVQKTPNYPPGKPAPIVRQQQDTPGRSVSTPIAATARIVSPAALVPSRANIKGGGDNCEQEQLHKAPRRSAAAKRAEADTMSDSVSITTKDSRRSRRDESTTSSAMDDCNKHRHLRANRSYQDDPASSAYVQHLAELSYTILNDVRWRVSVRQVAGNNADDMSKTSSVLAWENGDDLSAVGAFASVWDGRIGGQIDRLHPGFSASAAAASSMATATVGTGSSDQLSVGRALNLYSRLFVRKGPWFTADDLYFRYYRHCFTVDNDVIDNDGKSDDTIPEGGSKDEEEDEDSIKPAEFSEKNGESTESSAARTYVKPTLSDHRAALVSFFTDLIQLSEMRLLRTFDSEQECATVAGNTTGDGTGVLLSAASRSEVLSRLGGGNRIKKGRGGLSRAVSGDSNGWNGCKATSSDCAKRRRGRTKGASENLIWRQMTTQKSVVSVISSSSSSSSSSATFLPVRRHVHGSIWRKFASRIMNSVDNSSGIAIGHVILTLSEAWSEAMKAFDFSNGRGVGSKEVMSSIRLREAPVLTLRRASRLYLCAVGGPGSMRGGDPGASGWASVVEQQVVPNKELPYIVPFEARRLLESSGSVWHKVLHPGLSCRLGLSIFSFAPQYIPLHQKTTNMSPDQIHMAQVFFDRAAFHRWEACAELRATFDHLLELNEIIHYLCRRRKKEEDSGKVRDTNGTCNGESTTSSEVDVVVNSIPVTDVLRLLTCEGRKEMIDSLVTFDVQPRRQLMTAIVHKQVEATLGDLSSCNKREDAASCSDDAEDDPFGNDAERIICVVSVIGVHVLQLRFQAMSTKEMLMLAQRPWLRHLSWESALAYLLWDCVLVLEKKKCYDLAVTVLETILIGYTDVLDSNESESRQVSHSPFASFIRCLVSRRVRGKAFERLVIDQGHIERIAAKIEGSNRNNKATSRVTNGSKKKKNKHGGKDASPEWTISQKRCLDVIDREGRECSIPFSTIRTLARRLNVPLKKAISGIENAEMNILMIRSEDDDSASVSSRNGDSKGDKSNARSSYSEWRPKTDYSVANSITNEDKDGVGKRCAFVGWEDEDDSERMARTRSMNVEELALEEYAAGRLPLQDEEDCDSQSANVEGGWVGWHDEGGHVRALFRILCAPSILGIDPCDEQSVEQHTIFLAPYQGAPLDLHVGFQGPSSLSGAETGLPRGFFDRRRAHIDKVLGELDNSTPQDICDRVHDAIFERVRAVRYAGTTGMKDALLLRDLGEMRTLSFIAAGLGGKMLATIFRCLCFDYRHYAGGLPDLLLLRAVFDDDDQQERLVDLGTWVGEAFSAAEVQKGQVVELCRILADRDDEFLGCSKLGETGAVSSQRWRQSVRRQKQDDAAQRGEECLASSDDEFPQRLLLSSNGRPIKAECMFVEVKSANDRLDARQEDWLNILDGVGNARVCKFTNQKKKSGKKKGEKDSGTAHTGTTK